ncbi:MAG: patatin-like phospholipase family protein [Myxococcales bacterium]|nr:patatin-like phospholipase family protein [Myxococcales bacterium]
MAEKKKKNPATKFGLVLSGGGARGTFQVGVWEVLRKDSDGLRRLPEVVSGTSAGALNGALIAAGLEPEQMLEFWLDLARDPPVKANALFFRSIERALAKLILTEPRRPMRRRGRAFKLLGTITKKHAGLGPGTWLAAALEYVLTARFDSVSYFLDSVKAGHLFSTAPMRERLVRAIGGETISEPRCKLAINTVDVRTGGVVGFVSHSPAKHSEAETRHYRVGPITVDMILASASIPLLFNSVNVGGTELWDGGLLVNTPIAPTVALGAERIIPVLVNPGEDATPERALSLGAAVERLADAFLENAYSTDRKLLLERNRVAEAAPKRNLRVVQLYEAIRPASGRVFNAGSYLFFEPEALKRMYLAGKVAARRWLREGPLLDTHPGPDRSDHKVLRLDE